VSYYTPEPPNHSPLMLLCQLLGGLVGLIIVYFSLKGGW
jgi:hypothetical protein